MFLLERAEWIDCGDVIDLGFVLSDGTTGSEWMGRLECGDFRVSEFAKRVLESKDFIPTSGKLFHIFVLKGKLWKDKDRTIENARAEADKRSLEEPSAEVACLIREKFTDEKIEEMGFERIVVMHESIFFDGDLRLLSVYRASGGLWLSTVLDGHGYDWNDDYGFAFVCPASNIS